MNAITPEPKTGRASDYSTGRQYGRPRATHDHELTETNPGTLMGELLRRYWQPFALSSELNNDLPLPIRILGEDLVAFRDAEGKAGLMYPRCMHRGASLVLGKLEPQGLRCPYHGWMFDTQGHLLDTPCELDPKSTHLHRVIRQPWYPMIEKYGIAFTYMGPADKEPLFPENPLLDALDDDEIILPTGGSQPPDEAPIALVEGQMDMNWLQNFENFMDPLHLSALHSTINGMQFNEYINFNPDPCKFKAFDKGSISWIGQWENKTAGVITQAIFQTIFPNMHCEGPVFEAGKPSFKWVVPVDDHNYRSFTAWVVKKDGGLPIGDLVMMDPDKFGPGRPEAYRTWTLEDKQRWQTDFLVQQSQGPITLHSEERLTTADMGVVMLRRILKQQAKIVKDGGNPIGAVPGEADVIDVYASTARLDPATGEILEGYLLKTLDDYA
ncbi:Rieske 2Fe-2S domain-containing protein [Sphingobium phenoxybenzoativorans]|uniref:FNRc-type reductase n=1 Tax=Sphingobium phenoxybenzoativorans TaxID=1592790 RepID=A0A1W5YR26_9SPHN|nr:Rieske 2Fe-2S domain-containing protein [Sphingobium phenoxybenzoativorans]ARI47617.1 FNRc-type reductase [Sphingobium phenoxybenzoativorans]